MIFKKIIYAPLINTGGGKKLLFDLLYGSKNNDILFFLDFRIKKYIPADIRANIIYVKNNFLSLIISECILFLKSSSSTTILCFHGAPPIIKNPGYVIVFFQNRLYLNKDNQFNFLGFSKKYFFVNSFDFCQKIIVQTESMKFDLIESTKPNSISDKIEIIPFGNFLAKKKKSFLKNKQYDFIYVADGYGHKNHKNLILAWIILAERGIYPSLVLTLPKKNKPLISLIDKCIYQYNLNIINIFEVNQDKLISIYLKTRALIYPSFTESLGLPIIEASNLNIPIIASELDFVRDICNPEETFNPNSPKSISRAVERFLKIPNKFYPILTASQFINRVFYEKS
jgi:glycosyltransferase involved in cell wall biosynthesis